MYEMRALKEFTRIFPPEKKVIEKAFGEELEGDDEEGEGVERWKWSSD